MEARARRRWLATLGLLVVSVLVGLGLFELAARFALGRPDAETRRLLFFQAGAFAEDSCGAVHYSPNRTLRTAAIYGREIAYDVRFSTNDMGYVDALDYGAEAPATGRRIAFVGDSFTAGYHAGSTWLARLREATRAIQPELALYNLGVDGAGLEQFHTNLRCFLDRVEVDEVVVLFLSDDLLRLPWVPRESERLIHLCYPADCSVRRLDLQKLAHEDESPAELRARAERIYARWSAARPAPALERMARSSHLGGLASRIVQRLRGHTRAAGRAAAPGFVSEDDRRTISERLERFRRDFAGLQLRFMHLPQKPEVARGAYFEDLSGLFVEQGLVYVPLLERCRFSEQGFLERDAHPNSIGYEEISACVREQLGLDRPQAARPGYAFATIGM